MAIQRHTLNRYQDQQSLWEEKRDALNTLETKLSTLRTTLRDLSDADELRAFSVSSSDSDYLTADASYNAFEGSHTVEINQLANAERSVHTAGLEYAEDYVGEGTAGTFIYSYNHKETSINTTATTTLEDFVGLINEDANNPGVTASLLYYNDAYHLVLNGDNAGTDYKVFVNSSSTEVWKSDSELTYNNDNATLTTKITELDQFNGPLGGTDKITITGTDRNGVAITAVELFVTENTKIQHLIGEINDAFDGRAKAVFEDGKIILTDNVCGTSDLSITLTYTGTASLDLSMSFTTEGGATSANLSGFMASDFTVTQSAQDSKIKVDGYPTTSATAEVQRLTAATNPTAGKFTLTYNGQTTTEIDHDASPATIQSALEALSNVSSGDITVSAENNSLADGYIEFTFLSTAGDVDMIAFTPGTGLVPSARSNYAMTEQTKGTDGYISRSSNTVDDVIYGVALHLHDVTTGSGEQITLTRDIDTVKERLNSMISAYNLAVNYIKDKTEYDAEAETAGVLIGDYLVTNMRSRLRDPLISRTSGFIVDIDTFLTPGQIGIELDSDGLLSLDTNVFDEAIAEDYLGVLAVIGADKTGSSTSDVVEFYGASSRYTTPGEYHVKVTVSGGEITEAKIKLSTESSYRDMTFSTGSNIITGDSTFNDDGDPVYPENGLQLSVDLIDGTYGTDANPIIVRVKQGFTGAMEDVIDTTLRTVTGPLQISQKYAVDTIDALEDRIEDELDRLDDREARLIAKFAQLESTLAILQSQMAGLFGGTLL
jgi:flagellar hook-associated protein 2